MRCPFCGNEETNVKDSRICEDGEAIKRRRLCSNCDARFSTIERVIRKEIFVIKKDETKTLFDKDKFRSIGVFSLLSIIIISFPFSFRVVICCSFIFCSDES